MWRYLGLGEGGRQGAKAVFVRLYEMLGSRFLGFWSIWRFVGEVPKGKRLFVGFA